MPACILHICHIMGKKQHNLGHRIHIAIAFQKTRTQHQQGRNCDRQTDRSGSRRNQHHQGGEKHPKQVAIPQGKQLFLGEGKIVNTVPIFIICLDGAVPSIESHAAQNQQINRKQDAPINHGRKQESCRQLWMQNRPDMSSKSSRAI